MLHKLFRQSLKPFSRVLHEKAYKEWLRLFDFFKDENIKYPTEVKAMGYEWQVHHGATFINQFESIFIDQIYKFNSNTKSPIIIDCGANMGTSVLYFKWLYPESKITAFEPDQLIFEILNHNISSNKLGHVELINKAVWISNQDMFFNSNEAQSGKLTQDERNKRVSCVHLKNFLQNFKHIDFLKLDIEGAELPVLQDISSELHRIEHIFIEYHSVIEQPQKLSHLLAILEQAGFRYFIGGNHSKSPFTNRVVEDEMDLTLDIFATKS
ncbi:MAG TPA: FkbM family methyltransferase [Bacteroidia bacterium]|nr:FkbM family methyltransferase [Bacteroidia bacterium]